VTDDEAEIVRASNALEAVAGELERRASLAAGAGADVLTAQALMARDPTLAEAVTSRVLAGADAPHAVDDAFAEQRQVFESLGGYMAERAADLSDLRDRAVATLLGEPMPGVPDPGHPFVLVAADLAPADTAGLDPAKVLAIITERGGPTGHTAIIAKQLGIPAVVACSEAVQLSDGTRVLVDGAHGEVVVDPSEELIAQAADRHQELARRRAASRGPGRLADGHTVPLLANVGGPGDLASPLLEDSEGVGLLRTEFLFLDRAVAPSFDEQRDAYGEVFAAFGARRIVVRTLDVGADKPLPYLKRPPEPNPALGVRGYRLARSDTELLSEQLRAIAAAAREHRVDVWVMAPMVATAEEAREFATAARRHGLARAGVMIEVPSAALSAREILAAVDFASLGTNDLAQYAFAADRLAGELAALLDPWQPALLRLIEIVGRAGAELGKPVGVCGEAASDPQLAPVLVGLGATSLSMAPTSVPDVRAALAGCTVEDCRTRAAAACRAGSATDARAAVAELARIPRVLSA
jgi:phosphotransferase system enzyme I (PtsI)